MNIIFYLHVDPKIKATLKKHLQCGSDVDMAAIHNTKGAHTHTVYSHQRPEPTTHQQTNNSRTNGSCPEQEPLLSDKFEEEERLQWEPLSSDKFSKSKGQPKFEAYMMTGEHILNISRMPQTNFVPKQQKKVCSFKFVRKIDDQHLLNIFLYYTISNNEFI